MPVQSSNKADLKDKYVLLVNPPWNPSRATKEFFLRKAIVKRCYPPLGLGYLASYLEKCGTKVKIVDMQAQEGSLGVLAGARKPDFVGITATTVLINNAYDVAEQAKLLWPETPVVMGGIHITIRPREVLQNPHVDYIIRGEGEKSLALLVGGEDLERVPGLAYLENGHYREHPVTGYVENLDAIPMPSYHLMPMHLYNPPLGGALRSPSISIFSSRGCPGKCTYCVSAITKRTRFHSALKVVEEIEHLMANYGIREVTFYDDTFCSNRKRTREFCQLLIDRKIDLTWTCFSRIDFTDQQTLELMAKSGCHMICFGIENADKDILNTINKNIKLEMVIPITRMTQKAGIRVRHSFMLGLPGETRETLENTVRFAIKANPEAWKNYNTYSPAYRRIRVAYIDNSRKRPEVFHNRLDYFIKRTAQNKQIGYGGIDKYF